MLYGHHVRPSVHLSVSEIASASKALGKFLWNVLQEFFTNVKQAYFSEYQYSDNHILLWGMNEILFLFYTLLDRFG